ncbi:hypothetical protein [Rhodoplanes elegans]|uniref:hypothetical protein n=1 Tax=Rhodoplanes elegans TaxID=29408 RepID=UPI0011B93736|nr:hypothetical protein [Rhodoplanes elegans]
MTLCRVTLCRVSTLFLIAVLAPLAGAARAQQTTITTGFVVRMPMPLAAVPRPDAERPTLVGHGLSFTRRGTPMAQPGRAGLLMECRQGTLELLALDLDWPPDSEPVGDVDVTVLLDQVASPERWRILGNAYAPPDPAALLERFRTARSFALQVRTSGGERELSFDLRGVSAAAGQLRANCAN